MFPAGRAGWEEPVLGQDPQPGPCPRHLAGRLSGWALDPTLRGVWGSLRVRMGAQLPCRGASCPRDWACCPSPTLPLTSIARAGRRAAAAELGSPPWRRQQLSWTLFWMFMGFQFTPGSEAAKLPSQGASNPPRPASGPCLAAEEDFQSLARLSSWHGEGAWELCLCQGLAPVTEKSAANKILMGTYCIL